MHSRDAIVVVPGTDDAILHDLIQQIERDAEDFLPSTTAGGLGTHRISNSMRIPPTSRGHQLAHRVFGNAINDYKRLTGLKFDIMTCEGYNCLQYNEGGKYNLHTDDSPTLHRRLSGLLYLNDNYEGGELYFPIQDFTHKPKAGDVVLFPSGFMFPHAAKPVTCGTKLCIVTWFK